MRVGVLIAMMLVIVSANVQASDTMQFLVKNAKSSYVIVVSDNASPSEKHAASELQRFIYDVSGARLPVTNTGSKLRAYFIAVGAQAASAFGAKVNTADLGDEGFTIKTIGHNIVIAGGKQRGTMYGAYTFLEDVMGCRWYTSNVSRIPKRSTIKLPLLNITQKPDFEYRCVQFPDTWDADWAARNKINGPSSAVDDERGGKITYGRFAHTFDELVPASEYYNDHPEYYSLIDGKRVGQGAQLCLSNPDIVPIAVKNLLRMIKENPSAQIWSVSQNDNEGYCQCDKCTAIAKAECSQAGPVLRFVNAVAAEIAKEYPDKLIDTLAYNYSQEPPKLTKPRPNVRVRLCVFDCVHHPFRTCEANSAFMKRLNGWGSLCNGVYIWQYTTVFTDYLLPLTQLNKFADDIPMFKAHGVKGIFSLGSHSAGNGPAGSGGFMDGLKAYVLAKLFWNSKTDVKAVTNDFLMGYFGKSGKPIGEFLNMLETKVKVDHVHGWCATRSIDDSWVNATFTPSVMSESNRLFDEAEKVADNSDVLARVKHARLSIKYIEVMREVKHATDSGTAQEKAKATADFKDFAARCSADGIVQLKEGEAIQATIDRITAQLAK